MPRSPFWLTVVLVLAGLFLLRESRRADGVLAETDARFLDWLMANAGSATREADAPLPPVTLVEIDDAMLAERVGSAAGAGPDANGQPLSALDYALFLQAAEGFGAGVVAVEPILLWPRERQQPEYERILLNQALRTPKLLLGAHSAGAELSRSAAGLTRARVANLDAEPVQRPLSPLAAPGQALPTAAASVILPGFRQVRGDASGLPELPDLARRPAERLLLTGVPGPTDLPAPPAGSDGLTRTVPLLFRCQGDVLPSFTLQAAMLLLQLTPDEVQIELGRWVQLGNGTRVPIDAAGALRVDFQTGRRLPRLSLDDWLLAASSGDHGRGAATVPPTVRNGVVLLGRTDQAARELRLPPTGRDGSPTELFALAVATVARRSFIQRVPPAYDFLVVAAVASLGWTFLPLRKPHALALTAAFLLVYTLITLAIFEFGRLWLPWVLPAGLLGVTASMLALLPAERTDGSGGPA